MFLSPYKVRYKNKTTSNLQVKRMQVWRLTTTNIGNASNDTTLHIRTNTTANAQAHNDNGINNRFNDADEDNEGDENNKDDEDDGCLVLAKFYARPVL